MAAADRERQPAGRQPDDSGARDRRGVNRRDAGRPDAIDLGRGAGRGRRAQGQHQPDDRQPARDHPAQRRAGLAEDEPREHLRNAPGPARPGRGHAADHERGDADGERPVRRVLRRRAGRGRRDRAGARRLLRLPPEPLRQRRALRDRRGPGRSGGVRAQDDRAHASPRRLHQGRLGPRRQRRRRACW